MFQNSLSLVLESQYSSLWYYVENQLFSASCFRFLRSEFRGQLPQPFLREREDATRARRDNFNDANREEEDRYLAAGADGCHFIVDLEKHDGAETELEPNYSR